MGKLCRQGFYERDFHKINNRLMFHYHMFSMFYHIFDITSLHRHHNNLEINLLFLKNPILLKILPSEQ